MKSIKKLPLIFNIHRGSMDDGPGIRTVVFFKGCPLNCIWCHNPESIDCNSEIAFYSTQCIKCGVCKTICPNSAINFKLIGRIQHELCKNCGKCVNACPAFALRKIGEFYTVNDLTKILLLDKEFYKVSGGGVTFSGGEPLLYIDYLSKVTNELKKQDIHIAIQTGGFFDFFEFQQKVMKNIDIVYYDIKLIDSYLHKKYTGKDNSIIINNYKSMLEEKNIKVIPRVPLVPDITAVPANLSNIADFIRECGSVDYSLLTYNTAGTTKRLILEKAIPFNVPNKLLDKEEEKGLREMFEKRFRGK